MRETELRREIELLKEKLRSEFGFEVKTCGAIDSPELENAWLNQVYEFEKAFDECRKVSVYDYVGRPEFKPASELSEKELSAELARLLRHLKKNSVDFGSVCNYDDRVIYKFVTEELFPYQMDDIRIPNMITGFIYEEFHPNHEFDIRRQTKRFISEMLSDNFNPSEASSRLAPEVQFNGKKLAESEFIMALMLFREVNGKTTLIDMKDSNLEFDLESGRGSISGEMTYRSDSETVKGNYILELTMKHEFWYISGVCIPGFGDMGE